MQNNLWINESDSYTVEESKEITLFDALEGLPHNQTIIDNFVRAWSIINKPTYDRIIATISGGSDSDVILDILTRCDIHKKIKYIWINTGLEYQATIDHLDYLERKYNIKFIRIRPKKPIPVAVKQYGQPFLSKQVSEHLSRLQAHGFDFDKDGLEDFDTLMDKYPGCQSSLQWWCNKNRSNSLNVCNNKFLKEFLVFNPPTFKISNKCCYHAKKAVAYGLIKHNQVDLNIFGVRKAEGGARANAYKSCFGNKSTSHGDYDEYRPLWWYSNADKEEYCDECHVTHSACYTKYGLPRTGCCGCPFGRDYERELEVAKEFEPKLYAAAMNIFKDSYEYTKKYKEFVKDWSK